RLAAARALAAVLDQGRALDGVLEQELSRLSQARDRALARRLAHAVLRSWPALDALLGRLINRRPARRERLVWFILAVGLAELRQGREPAPAVVHAAVAATAAAGLARLKGLSNAVLRGYLRRKTELEHDLGDNPVLRWGYPRWFIDLVRRDWPDHWQDLLDAGNQPPPLTLRVNRRHWTRDQAQAALAAAGIDAGVVPGLPDALMLDQRAAVSALPGFSDGGLSVQDAAAQLAVEHLALTAGQRVLDACAAPGGKAAHILERADVALTAVDVDAERLARVADNFKRLGLTGQLQLGDATRPEDWWDGRLFDRILLDAPCSASGVIRRHPEVRWLRQPADIGVLADLQARMLDALWPLLAPGGILVYATCSVLADENQHQARAFLERHDDAETINHDPLPGLDREPGRQVLPGTLAMDGFYHLAVRRLPPGCGRASRSSGPD
ncbi:MAG: 16S rRNA (cytosine(967)-C(5))-methyltransferase RsmB, partial [Wenzhouxiangella sp.]|nr:16S rRNA (cytosine(967)-C(5))-methyltransferase RsmB [Wenzhouxiangella sp.]